MMARCDNIAVVTALNTTTCSEQDTMHLLQCLAFLEAQNSSHIVSTHIVGECSSKASAIFKGETNTFLSLHPRADCHPTPVPDELLDTLLASKPD